MGLYSNNVLKEDINRILSQEYISYEKMKEKSILITGATGMLAFYMTCVCMHLNIEKNYGIQVYALVRNEKKAKEKFEEFIGYQNFHLCVQDVCEPLQIEEHIDYIIHAAGAASPWFIKNDPVGIIRANTVGTMNVLEFARKSSIERVLFMSTREIYGEVKNTPWIKEQDMGTLDTLEARSCYPESKRMAEQIFESYYNQFGVPYVITRIAHSYGPGMIIENDGRVMSDFISDTVHGRNIIMKSEGLAERAFCYITDAVTALFTVLLNGETRQAYNIANETEPKPIREVAQMLVEMFPDNNRRLIFEIATDKSGYCAYERVGLDTGKLETLGWYPVVSLEEGLRNTVLSFKEDNQV